MSLLTLRILNYKNIADARLDFSPKINCLTGDNGMGKTNVLDAVYYLSLCRSASTPHDQQVLRHDADFLLLEGTYDGDPPLTISCGMKRGQKKHFRRGAKEYRRLSEHVGLIPVVLVAPADTLLVDGGGEERRHFMDLVVGQTDRSYLHALTRYGAALSGRGVLLRGEAEPDASLLDAYEEQMAQAGEAIYACRTAMVERLEPLFRHYHHLLAGEGHESVELSYVSHCQRGPLLAQLQQNRLRDRAVGYSLLGPHRDDLTILLDGHPMRREGSQGQLKTFVIALKLAQAQLLAATGTKPILLLDDIFDKLDARRVERIVDLVGGDDFGQIFITDTNRDHIDHILRTTAHDYRLFHVENGEVQG